MLVIAVGIVMVEYFIWPGEAQEFLCIIYGVPVMVGNLWEWCKPEIREQGDKRRMTGRRKIFLGFLAIAMGITVAYFIWPRDWLELLCYLYALPVVLVNVWEWFETPEFMDKIFGKR